MYLVLGGEGVISALENFFGREKTGLHGRFRFANLLLSSDSLLNFLLIHNHTLNHLATWLNIPQLYPS